jgi:hypothetical protein
MKLVFFLVTASGLVRWSECKNERRIFMFKVGDKVLITVNHGFIQLEKAPAIIVYIDQSHLFENWSYPIQVELLNPYDDLGQTVLRVNLKELKPFEEER